MAGRISTPGPKLRFMKDQEFEDEAALLLAEYGNKHGQVTATPIPVDEIVELYFGLSLEFHDMQKLFDVSDVHGALWVNEKRVGIDQRLDPVRNPAMLGRYHFTLAHEAGHWRLHRHLFQRRANQLSLLPEGVDRPEYICRSSDTDPIEYQANRFASCLLMPREMMKRPGTNGVAAWTRSTCPTFEPKAGITPRMRCFWKTRFGRWPSNSRCRPRQCGFAQKGWGCCCGKKNPCCSSQARDTGQEESMQCG